MIIDRDVAEKRYENKVGMSSYYAFNPFLTDISELVNFIISRL